MGLGETGGVKGEADTKIDDKAALCGFNVNPGSVQVYLQAAFFAGFQDRQHPVICHQESQPGSAARTRSA